MNLDPLWQDLTPAVARWITAAMHVPVRALVGSHWPAALIVLAVALLVGWLAWRWIVKFALRLGVAALAAAGIFVFWPALGHSWGFPAVADASGSHVVALTVTILGAWLLLSAAGGLFRARLQLRLLDWAVTRR